MNKQKKIISLLTTALLLSGITTTTLAKTRVLVSNNDINLDSKRLTKYNPNNFYPLDEGVKKTCSFKNQYSELILPSKQQCDELKKHPKGLLKVMGYNRFTQYKK